MTRLLVVLAALLTLAASAALAAPPADKGKPTSPGHSASAPGQAEDKNPAKTCKALRERDAAAFKTAYGDKPNAYGKCVSAMAKKKDQNEAKDEDENENESENGTNGKSEDTAAKKCKAMKKDDPAGFKTTYGDKPNAFGKCVSKLAKGHGSS
jgi:hypothetical protein